MTDTLNPEKRTQTRRCWASSCSALALALWLAGCAGPQGPGGATALRREGPVPAAARDAMWLDRLSWGATSAELAQLQQQGRQAWWAQQLQPVRSEVLPPAVQRQLAAQRIAGTPMVELVQAMEAQRKTADATKDDEAKAAAQKAYQADLSQLARESSQRMMLMALYSPAQLREQMLWFWLNHFNVHQYKSNIRAMVGDYETQLRTQSLGRFRDLLQVTVFHPAMLRYLDNDQNALGHVNENYARELLELHTLGVDGGYSQKDVQELARVLTGLGVNQSDSSPKLKPEWQRLYVRHGLMEFNPARHDFGTKTVLGQTVQGRGLIELDAVLDRLARHPSTAHFISLKLARYFVADEPDPALVAKMAERYLQTDGQIAEVLRIMVESPQFEASLGRKFKDPVHFVVSAVRSAYEGRPVANVNPMLGWLGRMGEGLYDRQTPDGYPLVSSAWTGPGQLATRFEIARSLGGGSAGLFKPDPASPDKPAFPQLATPYYYQGLAPRLSETTRAALAQATSPQDWGGLLLSSPEFMNR